MSSTFATLAVTVLQALLERGELPRAVETCIELARSGNLAGLQWALSQGVPWDMARCLEVAATQEMRDWIAQRAARRDPMHLIPLVVHRVFRLCANPIPYFARPNRPQDFGEIEELPF